MACAFPGINERKPSFSLAQQGSPNDEYNGRQSKYLPELTNTTCSTVKDRQQQKDELKQLLELFNQYDSKQLGLVSTQNVIEILRVACKNRQLPDAEALLSLINNNCMYKEGFQTFDEFLATLTLLEQPD